MASGVSTIIFPAADLAGSTRLFRALLGVEPVMEESYYVGFRVDGQDIGLDPRGSVGTGPISYWEVDDIEKSRQQLLDAGANERQPIHDVGGGKLIAVFSDPSGNAIGLSKSPW